MAFGDFKNLTRRTPSDKILRFNIAKSPKYDGYQRSLASMVYKYFGKKLLEVVIWEYLKQIISRKITQTNY